MKIHSVYILSQLPSDLNEHKAVLVWFHGGGFIFGSGNTDMHNPGGLMQVDVVLVTVNYRMGPFGK
jgi:carboxylesterase type B